MSIFCVHREPKKEGEYSNPELLVSVANHYCDGSIEGSEKILEFVSGFDRWDFIIKDLEAPHKPIVAYFSMTINDDMHLGNVAQYIVLFNTEEYRGSKEILKLINSYSKGFAKTYGCQYIAKVQHVSPTKRIESFKEVK